MLRIILILLLTVTFGLSLSTLLMDELRAEELEVLESQLNKNSITGVIQNPYNYTIGGIEIRAEFYDKEDGHLVGLRDFYDVPKDELKPNEKTTYKIYEHAGETEEFPKTEFIVKAEGSDYTNVVEVPFDEHIEGIRNISEALKSIPTEIVTTITEDENGTAQVVNKTIIYENGTTVVP